MAKRVWSTARWIASYRNGGYTTADTFSTSLFAKRSESTESLVIINNLQQASELDGSSTVQCDGPGSLPGSNLKVDLKNTCANKRLSVWFKNFALASLCVVVAVAFCIPVIVYLTGDDHSSGKLRAAINDYNFSNCSTDTMMQDVNTSTTLPLYDDNCSSYNGLCLKFLDENAISLSTRTLKGISDNDVANFIELLDQYSGKSVVSEQCAEVVLPFLCQYIHPPCDGNGSVNFISQEQCSNIRDVVCADEWRLVMVSASSLLLPVCEHFSHVDNNTLTIDDNATQITMQPLQCHYQFKNYCGLCRPLCGEFSSHSANKKLQEKITMIIAAMLALSGGILLFIVSIIRRKSMLSFPQIQIVYLALCAFIIACLILITFLGGQEIFFCTDEYLDVAVKHPSVFCQISGFSNHWLFMLAGILWFQHTCHLFMKIMFPMWSKRHDDKEKSVVLHVLELSGAIFISIIAPVTYSVQSEYRLSRFPPIFCAPSRIFLFYTLCLPLCMICGGGSVLLIIVLWTLVKRKQLFKKESSKCFCNIQVGIPEVKVFLILSYFVVFEIMALVTLGINVRDSETITKTLLEYIFCQLSGLNNGNSCTALRDKIESHLQIELNNVTYLLMGLLPWVILLLAIQFTDIKNALRKVGSACQQFCKDKRAINRK